MKSLEHKFESVTYSYTVAQLCDAVQDKTRTSQLLFIVRKRQELSVHCLYLKGQPLYVFNPRGFIFLIYVVRRKGLTYQKKDGRFAVMVCVDGQLNIEM